MARSASVPVVPGSAGLIEEEAEAVRVAHEIGFPVLIKATAGGGGKGMRVAANDLALKSALQQARKEAEAAFGNPGVYLEKYVENPRHVEVQILADQHGKVLHLWERDCSTQRRHQKLIEESPAPNLPGDVRSAICESAVRLIREANYTNAGTVEFIVDKENNFYFIEVNARIQVEHPVTEMVTGIDLIKSQIAVAAGRAAPHESGRDSAPWRGHGMSGERGKCVSELPALCRNDHANDCPWGIGGTIRFACSSGLSGPSTLRFDDWQTDRPSAHSRRGHRMHAAALDELRIEGIETTVPFHKQILRDSIFVDGWVDTTYVERMKLA